MREILTIAAGLFERENSLFLKNSFVLPKHIVYMYALDNLGLADWPAIRQIGQLFMQRAVGQSTSSTGLCSCIFRYCILENFFLS
jgi:hypothetical protein